MSLDAHNGLGYCDLRENKLQRAEEHFSLVLGRTPRDPSALEGMGLVRFRQGKLHEAETYLRKTLQEAPENAEAREMLKKIQSWMKKER